MRQYGCVKGRGNNPYAEAPRQREIWLCRYGEDAPAEELRGWHPVVIISRKLRKKKNRSITVVPLMKSAVAANIAHVDLPREKLELCKPKLSRSMWANVRWISTVPRVNVRRLTLGDESGHGASGTYRGALDHANWIAVQQALAGWFALGFLTVSNEFDT